MGKFNQAVVCRAPDQKNKGVTYTIKCNIQDANKFIIQNPVIGNLLSQVNANKITDAKVKQLLGTAKDEELRAR